MVSPELWSAANSFRYHRPHRGNSWPEGGKHSKDRTAQYHLLSRLCYCDYCQAKLYAWTRRRPASAYAMRAEDYVKYYYVCQKKRSVKYDACEAGAIWREALEPVVLDHVLGIYLAPDHIMRLVEQANNSFNSRPDLEREIEASERKLATLDGELQA